MTDDFVNVFLSFFLFVLSFGFLRKYNLMTWHCPLLTAQRVALASEPTQASMA